MTSSPPAASSPLRACCGLRPSSLSELARRSRFSREELKLMYRGFKNDCPSGLIRRHTFVEIFSQFFPLGDATSYAELVFHSFDWHGRGWLTFDSVIDGLSVVCRGSTDERLAWAFRLYDSDGDGSISRQEMHRLVTSIYSLLGCCVSPSVGQYDSRQRADQIFQLMDADKDGSVSFEEFVAACRAGGRDIERELACFDTLM